MRANTTGILIFNTYSLPNNKETKSDETNIIPIVPQPKNQKFAKFNIFKIENLFSFDSEAFKFPKLAVMLLNI